MIIILSFSDDGSFDGTDDDHYCKDDENRSSEDKDQDGLDGDLYGGTNAAFQVDPGDLQDEKTEQGGEDRRKEQRYLGRKSQPDVRARLQADVDHSEGDDKGADEQNDNSREKSRPTA